MKILPADEASAWLKARRTLRPGVMGAISWPEDPRSRTLFAGRVANLSDWRGGAVVLEKPGMPRPEQLRELCALHAALGLNSTPDDIHLGSYPGHVFDGHSAQNQEMVRTLLDIMMAGHIEGHLVTKDGRFWASVGCGIVEFRVADKALTGAVRSVIQEVASARASCAHMPRRRRTKG